MYEGAGGSDSQRRMVNLITQITAYTKKIFEKALIPLPPTGFVSFFCAKQRGGANPSPAQGRCGVCGVFGNFTK
jgi:hypothetical protein